MKNNNTAHVFRFNWLTAISLTFAVLLTAGCAMTPEQQYEKYMSKANAEMQKAVTQLSYVDEDLNAGNAEQAQRSFNEAIDYMDKSVVYYAKAVTTPDQKQAVEDLKKGLASLKSCVDDLEKGNVDAAQTAYSTAQGYFDQAGNILWETS